MVTRDGGAVFAPDSRSASQSLPLSDANASWVACLSLTLKLCWRRGGLAM